MLFSTQSFILSVSADKDVKKAGGSVNVKVNLTESDIPVEVLAASLMSGQSPRVRLQGSLRDNGIPKDRNVTLSWGQYVGSAKLAIAIPLTSAEIRVQHANLMQTDPEYRKAIFEQIQAEMKAAAELEALDKATKPGTPKPE